MNPAVKKLCIDLIDEVMNRPISKIFIDPKTLQQSRFLQIRNKISFNNIKTLQEFQNEIFVYLNEISAIKNPTLNIIVEEIKRTFIKKIQFIQKIDSFQFRLIIDDISKKVKNIEVSQKKKD